MFGVVDDVGFDGDSTGGKYAAIVHEGTFWCLVTSLRGSRHHLHNVYPEPDISSAEN